MERPQPKAVERPPPVCDRGYEMKCMRHSYEYGPGICASCLRERLLTVVAIRNDLSSIYYVHHWSDSSPPHHLHPPLLRPLSPFAFHRRSVGSDASPAHARIHHHFQRFFSTPQVGPTSRAANGGAGIAPIDSGKGHKFFTLKTLFGHQRSEEENSGLGASKVRAGSWLSAFIRGRRKNKKQQPSKVAEEEAQSWQPRRSLRAVDMGASPTKEDVGNTDDGYSSDEWQRSHPMMMRRFPTKDRQHRIRRGFPLATESIGELRI